MFYTHISNPYVLYSTDDQGQISTSGAQMRPETQQQGMIGMTEGANLNPLSETVRLAGYITMKGQQRYQDLEGAATLVRAGNLQQKNKKQRKEKTR